MGFIEKNACIELRRRTGMTNALSSTNKNRKCLKMKSNFKNKLKLQVISGAGHHIFADKPDVFSQFVNDACNLSDNMPNSIESYASEFLSSPTKFLHEERKPDDERNNLK